MSVLVSGGSVVLRAEKPITESVLSLYRDGQLTLVKPSLLLCANGLLVLGLGGVDAMFIIIIIIIIIMVVETGRCWGRHGRCKS